MARRAAIRRPARSSAWSLVQPAAFALAAAFCAAGGVVPLAAAPAVGAVFAGCGDFGGSGGRRRRLGSRGCRDYRLRRRFRRWGHLGRGRRRRHAYLRLRGRRWGRRRRSSHARRGRRIGDLVGAGPVPDRHAGGNRRPRRRRSAAAIHAPVAAGMASRHAGPCFAMKASNLRERKFSRTRAGSRNSWNRSQKSGVQRWSSDMT